MTPWKPWSIVLLVAASAVWAFPMPGRAQAPGQSGFYNKSDFRSYDAFLFNYPVQGGGNANSLQLTPFASDARFAALKAPGSALPTGLSSSGAIASGFPTSSSPAGRLLRPWAYDPERKLYYAIALTSTGVAFHWIWRPSQKDTYYLYDPARADYVGAYDRATRLYRPYDPLSKQWKIASAPPVPLPAGPPTLPILSREQARAQPEKRPASDRPRAAAELRSPTTKAESPKSGPQ